jgi:deoxyribose-phosphate aldolase
MDENRIENAAPVIGTVDALAAYVELPLLAPVLSEEQIHAGLAVAREFALAAVCVRPCDVDVAVRGLSQSRVRVAAAVSYPDGSATTSVKLYEARDALRRGARELDVVVNLGMMYSRQFVRVESELQQLAALCRENEAKLKAVFEFPVLNHELRIIACKLARRTGVDYVVNSTGRVRQENFDSELQLALDRRFGLFEVKATGVAETAEAVLGLVAKGVRRVVLRRPETVLEEFGKQLEAAAAPPELPTGA